MNQNQNETAAAATKVAAASVGKATSNGKKSLISYRIETSEDWISNEGGRENEDIMDFDNFEAFDRKKNELLTTPTNIKGRYLVIIGYSVETFHEDTDDNFVGDDVEKELFFETAPSATLPEGSVVVYYEHVTYMNYSYRVTSVEDCGGKKYDELGKCLDYTGSRGDWCDVFENLEDLQNTFECGWGIFAKLQGGRKIVLDFIDENTELCETYDDLEHNVWVEVSQEFYEEALDVLPPNLLKGFSLWQVGECAEGELYHTFCQVGNKYYGALCTENWALNNPPC